MRRRYVIFISLILMGMGFTACAAAPESGELVNVNLPMGYIADPQYAPFYVALEKGYFAEEGLDIAFDYSFETDGMALVGANQRPFAIVSGDQVLLARAQDLPVVYVLEWFQKYPIAIISKGDAGIDAPADLSGRSVGLPGFFGASYVGYLGLLAANGLVPEDVKANDIGFTQVESLLADQAEAVVGYANNEAVQLTGMGEDVEVLYVSDYIDMVANGIVTNETVIAENPELVEGFVRASLRGLADTLADPDAAFTISKQYVEGLEDERKPVLEASLLLWEADKLGETTGASWQQTQEVMLGAGLLDAPLPDLEAIYTNEFVDSVQDDLNK